MKINLITNLFNGVGLQKDYELLSESLRARGHQPQGIQFNAPESPQRADLNVFLEVVTPDLMKLAPKNWAVPNPEWWFAGWNTLKWDRILCKTRDCFQIFKRRFPAINCTHLGWKAKDFYDGGAVSRTPTFLHVAGKSRFKNTDAVIKASKLSNIPVRVVSQHYGVNERLTETALKKLMNQHLFHLMPSMYEGYGMVLHEALGCGQILLTTNAAPMNESPAAVYFPSSSCKRHHYGMLHTVTPQSIAEGMRQVLRLNAQQLAEASEVSRTTFLRENAHFEDRLDEMLRSLR